MAASSLGFALLRNGLETAIDRFLALDPDSGRLLQPLQGKLVALHVLPFPAPLYLYHTDLGVQVHRRIGRDADVSLSGTPWAFAAAGLGPPRESALFGGQVRVEGDADVAKRFAQLLSALQIDWESMLSRALGPDIGDRVATGLLAARRWGRESLKTLRMDASEYLQEESHILPTQTEVEAFLRDVDKLRADSDRLAARIQQLRAKSTGQGPT